jgi:hypothetical protein
MRWPVLACAVLLGACSAGSPVGKTESFQRGIFMSTSQEGLDHNVVGTHFNLWSLRALYIRTQVEDLPHTTILELRFINPIGEVILEEHSAFSPDPTVTTVDDPLLGMQANVFTAKKIRGGYSLDRWIAVAGSVLWRVPYREGDWEVQALLAGVPGMLSSPLQLMAQR